MEALINHIGNVIPLDKANVDTDQIIPKQFLKRIERTGFGQFLFYDWRYEANGEKNDTFIMNDPKFEGASILLARKNFGCGSSREHAPWALKDYGIKVVIKNGILPVVVKEEEVEELFQKTSNELIELEVDLEYQEVCVGDDLKYHFEADEYRKQMLLKGLDDIGLTEMYTEEIYEYEQTRRVY